ncbi:transporter [Methylobacterium sp. Leaf469]|uniref:AEC family transporter n=1 Tax=unclassified Methylobacterium TaxID=2615210 RepID=UPI0006F61FFF|nr:MULTISPECIES: AEC family transporter [unclassified Methylobacterium]USU33959.1 AEC family transporter [Methylobacterium sp. OTU13CASTA1]KQO59483.1 transporter [Methylobacterium sp. Leaf87]KQP28470.1 transporter [Methylobacterium sp. Leaf102]KQP60799.1 transporter [Methylobacterium sp. Leaf112]KQT90062.1 transporter [Methylobacterium sp. Leaf469]
MIGSVLLALVPIGLLIALGATLRRVGFLGEGFWPQAERLSYYVLLPSLMVHGLTTARLDGVPVLALVVVLVVSTCAVAAILLLARSRLGFQGASFTSVFQGGIRFNNYVGVSAAIGVFGAQGLALAAVANAAIVPTVNILCVLVFARFGTGERPGPAGLARQLALNPLVIACFGGILLQASGLHLPPGIEPMLKALGQASLPLGLLCVGAALDLSAARTWMRPVLVSSAVKFVLMPVATVLACRAVGLHGPAAVTALIFQVLPTASSSYIMARQLGGDAPLMAGIVAVQTILAGLAIPLVLTVFQGFLD